MVSRKPLSPAAPSAPSQRTTSIEIADERHLEREVLDKLHGHPGLNVGSLVVHRCQTGLCLEGHVVLIDPAINLGDLLAEIDTTTPILNRVMVSSLVADDV